MANEVNSKLTRKGLRLIVEPLESRRLLASLASNLCDAVLLSTDASRGTSLSNEGVSESTSESALAVASTSIDLPSEPTAVDNAQLDLEGEDSLPIGFDYAQSPAGGDSEATTLAADWYESFLPETASTPSVSQTVESETDSSNLTDSISDEIQDPIDEDSPIDEEASDPADTEAGNLSGNPSGTGSGETVSKSDILGGGTISIGDPDENVSPLRNPANPNDINGDGFVSPIDVLIVINFINAQNSGSTIAAGESSSTWPDASGDGFISPIDVLLVINQLNEQARIPGSTDGSLGDGEGEFAPPLPQNDFFASEDFLRQRKRDLQVDAELIEILDQLSEENVLRV